MPPRCFAQLATVTPQERLGQTMGAAEVGRELGDSGGPLLVGAIATAATLGAGYWGLAAALALAAVAVTVTLTAACPTPLTPPTLLLPRA